MTVHVRIPYCQVTIDGQVVSNVLSASGTLDYGQRTGQATVSVPFTPAWARFKSLVVIRVGGDITTAAVRFVGFITRFSAKQYPMQTDIICKGPLFFASTDMNNDPAGIDLSAGGAGQTDQAIVAFLLHEAGLDAYVGALGGTGKTLGTVATDQYRWPYGVRALDMIDQIDTISLGYRTFETFGGTIVRSQITAQPGATAAATFTEGVDMEAECTSDATIEDIYNEVQVTGYAPSGGTQFNYTLEQSNPYIPNGVETQQLSSPLLESSTTGGAGISCQEVAEYLLPVVNRGLLGVTCQTPRDDVVGPGMTIAVNAIARLGVNQNLWVQGMHWEYTQAGSFYQVFTCLGYALGTGGTGTTSGGTDQGGGGGDGNNNPPDGGGGGSSGGGGTPPTNTGPTVDFTLSVEQESVIVSGAYVDLFVVTCISAVTPGTGAISSYAWTTSGGSPHPSSGSDQEFTTSYAAISTQTITLTVTDANGKTGTATHSIPVQGTVPYLRRRIFLAGTGVIDDFDGITWRTHANSSTVVGNGPLWASGASLLTSTDDLQSAPHSVNPFSSGNVSAVWFESDASQLNVLVGSSNGALARSGDGGVSFTICDASPDGTAILRCVWSRYVRGQFFALTAGGLFRSDNYGNGWVRLVAAAGGETFRDLSVSFARIMIAMSGGRLICDQAGTAQTLLVNSGDIYAITADIRADRFYAYDSAGHTFYHTADGGTTLDARADLPASAAVRGLWRDSQIRGLLYVAAGAAYKSVDGFGSNGGYFQLRASGVGGATGTYVSIGTDGKLSQATEGTVIVYSSASVPAKAFDLGSNGLPAFGGSPPANWNQPGFNDSGWVDAVIDTGDLPSRITSADPIWVSNPGTAYQEVLIRQHFTVGYGHTVPDTVFINVDDAYNGVWLNGVFLGSRPGTFPAIPATEQWNFPASLLRVGDNVIAVWAKNDNDNISGAVTFRIDIT